MQSYSKRKIRSGKEFDPYIPKPEGVNENVVPTGATLEDTMKLIQDVIKRTTHHTKNVIGPAKLKAGTLEQTCENVFDFIFNHIRYVPDKAFVEQVRSPRRTWHDRKGDCDCYTVMIGSLLMNLGIPFKLRITKYFDTSGAQAKEYSHIYVVVPKSKALTTDLDQNKNRAEYLVIDPVTDQFNYEVMYSAKKDYPMTLQYLDGLGCPPNAINMSAAQRYTGAEAGKKVKELIDQINAVTPSDKPGIVALHILDSDMVFMQDAKGAIYMYMPPGLGSRAGNWIRKQANRIGKVIEFVTIPLSAPINVAAGLIAGKSLRDAIKTAGDIAGDQARPVINAAGEVVRFVNRFVNPVTIATRNAWLFIIKQNLFGLANRMRWAYAPQIQAVNEGGFQAGKYNDLVNKKNDLENIYRQAGGKVEVLRKAFIEGKGNKDGKVKRGNLFGFGNTSTVEYSDPYEYAIANDVPVPDMNDRTFGDLNLVEFGKWKKLNDDLEVGIFNVGRLGLPVDRARIAQIFVRTTRTVSAKRDQAPNLNQYFPNSSVSFRETSVVYNFANELIGKAGDSTYGRPTLHISLIQQLPIAWSPAFGQNAEVATAFIFKEQLFIAFSDNAGNSYTSALIPSLVATGPSMSGPTPISKTRFTYAMLELEPINLEEFKEVMAQARAANKAGLSGFGAVDPATLAAIGALSTTALALFKTISEYIDKAKCKGDPPEKPQPTGNADIDKAANEAYNAAVIAYNACKASGGGGGGGKGDNGGGNSGGGGNNDNGGGGNNGGGNNNDKKSDATPWIIGGAVLGTGLIAWGISSMSSKPAKRSTLNGYSKPAKSKAKAKKPLKKLQLNG
jgi:hypothetical protein